MSDPVNWAVRKEPLGCPPAPATDTTPAQHTPRPAQRIPHEHTLSDLLAERIAQPDPVPTPPVDLMQILMGEPG